MAILIDAETRIAVQTAFEGHESPSILKMPVYASNTVAHVTSRGSVTAGAGHWFLNSLPVFASIGEAVARTKANASLIYAAPALAAGAVLAAIDAGVPLVVLIAEDVPAEGRALIREALADTATVLVGPGAPELVTPDGCQIGATPSYIFARGRIGILSETGALAREAALQTSALGLGQSSVISLNRTPLFEGAFIHCLKQFLDDDETDSIVLLTDGDGQIETAVAALLAAEGHSKPIVAHIGALQKAETPAVAALRDTGVTIVESPARIGVAVKTALDGRDSERRVRLVASDFITVMRRVEQEIYGAPQAPTLQSA